jgi:transposase
MDGGFDLLLQGDGLDRLTASIEREKLRRAAQTSLISFTEYTFPKYRPAAHHVPTGRAPLRDRPRP